MKLQWFNGDTDPDNGDNKPDLFLSIQGKFTCVSTLHFKM